MPRPRKPYLHKETNRHGRTVWYVRNKDVGGKRTRIRGEYGSVEFNRNYDIAVADMFNRPRLAIDPNETTTKVFNGSLKWLWEEYKAKAPDWREMKASTHKQRNNLMMHVLEANGNKKAAAIQKQHILDGLGRRAQKSVRRSALPHHYEADVRLGGCAKDPAGRSNRRDKITEAGEDRRLRHMV